MKFKETSDLTFDERTRQVSEEIKKEYPLINDIDIYEASALAIPIDDKSTYDDKFDRYYSIMYVIGKNHVEFPHVFNDAFNLYSRGLLNNKNISIMNQIIQYIYGEIKEFPTY